MALMPWEIDRRTGVTYTASKPKATTSKPKTSTSAQLADLAMLNTAKAYSAPTKKKTASTSTSSVSRSSGAGGGGGSSGGSGGSASASGMRSRLLAELDGLEAERAAERKRLESQFVLAETDQERTAIARSLAAIDARYDEGVQMLTGAYNRATENLSSRIDETTARRESDMGALIAALEASANRTGEMQAVMEGRDAAYGVGATLGGTRGGDAYAAEIADLAQIEGALSGQLNDISAQDQEFLLELMELEAPASQGALRRSADDRSSAAEREHDQRVQARIAADRQLQAQLLAQLDSDFRSRQGQLEGSLLEEEMFSRNLAAEQAMQAASLAAARRGGGGGGGGGGSGGGGPAPGGDPVMDALMMAEWEQVYGPQRALELAGLAGMNTSFLYDNNPALSSKTPQYLSSKTPQQIAKLVSQGGGGGGRGNARM